MAYPIADIEGIGPAKEEKLNAIGIKTVEDLLAKGGKPAGRKEIADKTGISDKEILRYVNHADLFRIKGISSQTSELLEAAGVDTVKELATRNAANLHAAMEKTNESKGLSGRIPSESQIQGFIDEAKTLPRAVEY